MLKGPFGLCSSSSSPVVEEEEEDEEEEEEEEEGVSSAGVEKDVFCGERSFDRRGKISSKK